MSKNTILTIAQELAQLDPVYETCGCGCDRDVCFFCNAEAQRERTRLPSGRLSASQYHFVSDHRDDCLWRRNKESIGSNLAGWIVIAMAEYESLREIAQTADDSIHQHDYRIVATRLKDGRTGFEKHPTGEPLYFFQCDCDDVQKATISDAANKGWIALNDLGATP